MQVKDHKVILKKIYDLERKLEEFRSNVRSGGCQNKDLVNEPLYNQAQALRWTLGIELDEEIDEIDLDLNTIN